MHTHARTHTLNFSMGCLAGGGQAGLASRVVLPVANVDERLRPAEPECRLLLLLGMEGAQADPDDRSKWLQSGCSSFTRRLGDTAMRRPYACGVAVSEHLWG